jgi:hypothetical protein
VGGSLIKEPRSSCQLEGDGHWPGMPYCTQCRLAAKFTANVSKSNFLFLPLLFFFSLLRAAARPQSRVACTRPSSPPSLFIAQVSALTTERIYCTIGPLILHPRLTLTVGWVLVWRPNILSRRIDEQENFSNAKNS